MVDSQEIVISGVRSAFAAIPYIGGALNELAFEYRSRVKQKRIEEFLSQVKVKLEALDAQSVKCDYLESEDFADFLESVFIHVVRTGRQRKRDRLRDLLVRQVTIPTDVEFAEVFLSLANELSEREVEILIRFREAADYLAAQTRVPDLPEDEVAKRTAHLKAETYSLDESAFQFMLQHLCARGLLVDDSMNRWNTRPFGVVLITEFGRRFLEFLVDGYSD